MLHDSRLTPTRDTLKHETCAAEFPAQCVAALEQDSALIAQQAAHEPPLRLSRNLVDFREAQKSTPVRLLRARRLLICALLAESSDTRARQHRRTARSAAEHRARSLAPARRKCSSLQRIRAMSLSATAEATIPQVSMRLLARLPSCVSWRTRLAAAEQTVALGRVLTPQPADESWGRGGRRERGLVPASKPPRGGRAATRVARQRSPRRPSGKNSRGSRAAFGGVWRLGAAGCCKRRGEHVRALGCVPSALPRTFPWASRGRLCSSGRALSPHFRSARQGRALDGALL